MRVLPLLALTATCLLAVGLAACGDDDDEASGSDDRVKVITTLPLFADFVREIGGDRVEVDSLLPLGADPHTFEPSPRDVERVTEAEIAFANGLDLEPSLISIIEPNLPEDAELVLLGQEAINAGAEALEGGEHEEEGEAQAGAETEGETGTDPHMWMDPENATLYVSAIRDRLSAIDEDGREVFDQNYETYTSEIADARDYVSIETEVISEDLRELVTSHDAFAYFAGAFGFQITEFVAEAPGGDPSPEDIAEIAAVLGGEAVPAVFAEPQIGEESQILEQAAADAGVEVCVLYSDSLDETVTSYVELLRFNADELARCLGGSQEGG